MKNLRTINTTLSIIEKDNKVLLGEKKRGFAKGTFNGIGGKQDPNETIFDAMIRETQEEIGVTPTNCKIIGNIDFYNITYKGEKANINMSIYSCLGYDGDIKETSEMIPKWFEKDKLPFDKMLPDDVLWFPLVLQGKLIKAEMTFDENMNRIDYKIIETNQEFLNNLAKNIMM